MLTLRFLAASSTDPQAWNFGVFGIGAIVFVILSSWLFLERRERLASQSRADAKDKTIELLQLARLQDAQDAGDRERVMWERTLPLLGDTAKVLDASLAQARSQASQKEINETVTKFEAMVEKMLKERQ